MNTTELERCLKLTYDHDTYDKFTAIFVKEYFEPLIRELTVNLLEKESFDGKTGVFRHYLFELRCSSLSYQLHEEFEALVFEMKCICMKFNIDFAGIVNEYGISDKYLEDVAYLGYDFDRTEAPPDKNEPLLKSLFAEWVNDWEKYFDVFTETMPPLLIKTETSYRYIGNQRGHSGVIATQMKMLKGKGILKQSLDRDTIATILSKGIDNYTIAGSSIDNESRLFRTKFEEQIKEILSTN
jgi:hypothetical protein